jgi:hypothetical protein
MVTEPDGRNRAEPQSELSSRHMSRVASLMVALIVALLPLLGETCVLRCHHAVACHRQAGSPPAEARCHQSASTPDAIVAPTGRSCDERPFSVPALRPSDAGAAMRALAVPAAAVTNAVSVAIATESTTGAEASFDRHPRTPGISSIPLRV